MLSIVVPVFNEEESLLSFYSELTRELKKIDKEYEAIFVDDGSTDKSLEILKDFAKKDKTIRVFSFRRNLGKSDALSLGFEKSRGETVVTLDADLQDKPSEISKLLEKRDKGVDLVCGWRKNRKDKKKMLVISRLFNKIMNHLFGLSVHDYNCGLKAYSLPLAKSLKLYGGLHRFIPQISAQNGFSVDEVEVTHETRKYGKSKYGFSKVVKDLPDLFTMFFLAKYRTRPMHFFGFIGGGSAFIGFLILAYLTVLRFMGHQIGDRPLLFFGILLFIAGLQIFFTGFLADLMTNILQGSKKSTDPLLKYSSEDK
jgi:glycosyltransferase involved in cell wall biosynthesis